MKEYFGTSFTRREFASSFKAIRLFVFTFKELNKFVYFFF